MGERIRILPLRWVGNGGEREREGVGVFALLERRDLRAQSWMVQCVRLGLSWVQG